MSGLAAELTKLRKRPASWALGAVLALGVALFGYLLTYLLVANPPGGSPPQPSQLKDSLLPENLLPTVLSLMSGLGGTIALILGALVAGSEYGWGTLKAMLVQRSGRSNLLLAKALAISVVLAAFALVVLATGALSSFLLTRGDGTPVDWPSALELIKGAGAAWLILFAWAALGFFLATVFKGPSLAIGLGLVYALVLESLVSALPQQSDTLDVATKLLLGENSLALANAFGVLPQPTSRAAALADPVHAVLVLVAYAVVLFVGAGAVVVRRDVS